ncbi:hypothetical protein ABZW11_26520 [Nonomuraea sp. NPDC004580]|uniref:hypothetical protein n=1 Tax=Nonomuraea sp. NPDC004580 TaxID=3154552 RepID=UPI0033AE18D0
MGESRVWAAALGTPLDGPSWAEIGTLVGDGLGVEHEEPLPADWPFDTLTTITGRVRLAWGGYRWLFRRTSPAASRVKREYRRRRR